MRWLLVVTGMVAALVLLLVPRAPEASSDVGPTPRVYVPVVIRERALFERSLGLAEPYPGVAPTGDPVTVLPNSSVFTRADGNGVQVVAEVQNHTGDWINAYFTVTLYHEGEVVLSHPGVWAPDIPPHGRNCITTVIPTPVETWDQHDFVLSEHGVSEMALEEMTVVETEGVYTPPFAEVGGVFRNDYPETLHSGTLYAWLYDANKQVVACGHQRQSSWPSQEEWPLKVRWIEGEQRATYSGTVAYVYLTVAWTNPPGLAQ